MSNAVSIATVTAVLQDILFLEILNAPATESVAGAEVLTLYPGSEADTKRTNPFVNIYLYQVSPNAALRNSTLPARPSRVALDLHYLISFSGNEETLEPQRLAGLVTRALAKHALLSRGAIRSSIQHIASDPNNPKKFLSGSNLAEAAEVVKLTPVPMPLDEMSKLWSVFFQTKYLLSVAYLCSLVEIDPAEPEPTVLPVLTRNIEVFPLAQPVIKRVVPSGSGAGTTIVPGGEVSIQGTELAGQLTTVRIGTVEVSSLLETSGTELRFALPAGLRAGVHALHVQHSILLGSPPTPRFGLASSPAAFALSPVLAALSRQVRTTPKPATEVTASFTPAVAREQQATLLLRAVSTTGQAAPARLFAARARDQASDPPDTTTLVFPVSEDVVAGSYVASLLVDGAESAPLQVQLT